MRACDVDALSRYLDSELTLPVRREVESHIYACDSCARELETLRNNDGAVRIWALRQRPVPEALEARIAQNVKRRRFGPLGALSKMMPAALGTSVAAVLVLLSANLAAPYAPRAASVRTPAPAVANKTLVKQSAQLLMSRRTSAMVAGRVQQEQPVVNGPHRLHFDVN